MEEKEHILKVLKGVRDSLKKQNYTEIKNLSNEIIHNASINQNPDVISLAVIIYSLSKILERKKYTYYEEWPKFYKSYMENIERAIKNLRENRMENFRENISNIRKDINILSGKFKKYIQDVFRKAEINKASRIYEHGISMEQTSKLLGITIWELAEYSGQTGIADADLSITLPIKQRIKTTEEIFEK